MTGKSIQMVDLKGQYLKIKDEINTAIQEVIDSTAFIKGPAVSQFQEELQNYLSVKHVIACANGTDALQIAMMALDLQPGDEIITSPFTFIATVEVIKLLKLKPVLAEVDPDSFNINPEEIKKLITPKTRAIVPVHLFGQCANMDEISKIARENKLVIIEDTAQAMGADYFFNSGHSQKAGTIGDIGCTSFFPSKNLGAYGDGGALFTNNDLLGEKLKALVNHGMKTRYYYDYVGVNSRLDTLQAAILKVKLKYLDEYNQTRQSAAYFYDNAFKDLSWVNTPYRSEFSSHIFHQYTLLINNGQRNELKAFLESSGIPAMIYYPVGLHLQKAYRDLGYKYGDFPVTEDLSEKVLSLPMHTELDKEQLNFISRKVIEFVN
jgi:UDP-2-acetamido-2-deoxy-ribo-hexuluronate aminotransferase